MLIQFDDKFPIYIQIMNIIKKDIVIGKLKENEKLPSVREMGNILKVNPNTVQRSYQELERENIIFTQRGMGSFIVEGTEKSSQLKKEMSTRIISVFINGMTDLGFDEKEIITTVKEYLEKENE